MPVKKKVAAAGETEVERACELSGWGSGAHLRAPGGVQGQQPSGGPGDSATLWGFTYFECLRRALLHPINIHIHDLKTKTKKKQKAWLYSTSVGEVYAWVRNKLLVLNIILCWFCSTMLQKSISWMEITWNWKMSANVIPF